MCQIILWVYSSAKRQLCTSQPQSCHVYIHVVACWLAKLATNTFKSHPSLAESCESIQSRVCVLCVCGHWLQVVLVSSIAPTHKLSVGVHCFIFLPRFPLPGIVISTAENPVFNWSMILLVAGICNVFLIDLFFLSIFHHIFVRGYIQYNWLVVSPISRLCAKLTEHGQWTCNHKDGSDIDLFIELSQRKKINLFARMSEYSFRYTHAVLTHSLF